ncbi:MAG: hypothetical protein SWZ49_25620, partial [Cyanobacteriota bacterium]|nr:hypothetical protein [Cyanobacteriota bacterium]
KSDWAGLLVRFNVLFILASELIPRWVLGLIATGARCQIYRTFAIRRGFLTSVGCGRKSKNPVIVNRVALYY